MNSRAINIAIYKQAKRLQEVYKLPLTHDVYIHWQNNSPVVLPTRSFNNGITQTVRLEKILKKQCILV
jgi:hypothetical protein